MSEAMEELMMALYLDRVPASWAKRAWPSRMSLRVWVKNFSDRLFQLEEWMNNPSEIPKVTWLSGLVNVSARHFISETIHIYLFNLNLHIFVFITAH